MHLTMEALISQLFSISIMLFGGFPEDTLSQNAFNILFLYSSNEEAQIANYTLQFFNEFHKAELEKFSFSIQYQQINTNDPQFLRQIINSFINVPRIHVVLGPGTQYSAEISADLINNYKIPQIGYNWASSTLSNKTRYIQLFKLLPSEEVINEAMIQILFLNNWRTIATLEYDTNSIYEVSKSFRQLLSNYSISLKSNFVYKENISKQLDLIKTLKSRIVINFLPRNLKINDFECSVYNNGMYGPLYQWMSNVLLITNSTNCTLDNQIAARQAAIYFLSEIYNQTIPQDFIGKKLFIDYIQNNMLKNFSEFSTENLLLMDSLWAIFLSINQTRILFNSSLLNQDYLSTSPEFEQLANTMRTIRFAGLTGMVSFNENGDRMSRVNIYQFQNKSFIKCGSYDPSLKSLTMNSPFWFPGGVPPKDSILILSKINGIDKSIYYTFLVFAGIFISISLTCIILNIKFRHAKIIRMSSSNLNNLMTCGIVMSYLSIIPIGYSPSDINGINESKWVCHARVWLLMLSFDCIFGSLFSKTWRIHMIFSKSKMHKKNVIKDLHLFLIISLIVLLDIVLLFIWELTDNLKWCTQVNNSEEVSGYITENIYVFCCARNSLYFMPILFSIKGILLLIGLHFAWETRKVHIEILNDSKQVGMAIYIVIMMATVIIPLEYMLDNSQVNPAFYVLAAAIIICSFTTLSLVFVPKFLKIWQHGVDVGQTIENFTSKQS